MVLCVPVFAYMCSAPHVCSAQGDQKRALGSLELELQMVVSRHVGARNQTSGRAANAPVHGATSPAHFFVS